MHSSLFRATVALMAAASALTPPLPSLQNGPASATSRAQTERPKTIADQSISGDVYRMARDTLRALKGGEPMTISWSLSLA
jgi:hypothetical protein